MNRFLPWMLCFTIAASTFAQTTLKGVVTDANNKPVPGAVIQVSNSDRYSLSDLIDGSFTIELEDGYEIITISAEGFQTQKIYLTGQSTIEIKVKKLKNGGKAINTGYGSVSKDELSSSVSTVDAADISPAPLINLEQANQGVTAGLFVQNSGGKLGQETNVRVRGGSSLTASNQPLYVVDGVPLVSGNQSNINPSNIASIEILKDAAATAIYGSRAANGVIIITTKEGGSGKLQVNVDYQFGLSQTPKYLDLLSASEYNQLFIESTIRAIPQVEGFASDITPKNLALWEASLEGVTNPDDLVIYLGGDNPAQNFSLSNSLQGELSPVFNLEDYNTVKLPAAYLGLNNGQHTDWQREIFRDALSHRANVDFQGGTEALGYFSSIGYSTQEGILIGNKFDRINGTLSLDSKLSTKLSANLNLNFIYTDDDRLNEDQDLGSPMQAIALPPSDTYDAANDYQLNTFSLLYNPLTEINFSDYDATNQSIIGSLGLKYQLTDDISFDVNGGLDNSDVRVERRQGPETQEGAGSGFSQLSTSDIRNYVFNGWFTYDKDDLNIVFGGSYQDSQADYTYLNAPVNSISLLESPEGVPVDDDPIPGDANDFKSLYTRVSYLISEKYSLEASGRMDKSSKFLGDNRTAFFPAVSGMWNVQKEGFFTGTMLSDLKLRASYGIIGNTPVDDFAYQTNYLISQYRDDIGFEIGNLATPDLKWETTSQLNLGLDFALANNKVSGSVDYYIKTTQDLIFPKPIDPTSGQSSTLANIGTMENKGFEFLISSTNVSSGDFVWTTDFNISTNTNLVTDLEDESLIVGTNAFLEGQTAGVFYLVEYLGVDPVTGEALYDDGTEEGTTEWSADLRKPVGNPNPKFFGGITNSVQYKNWEMSALFQFVSGVDIYNASGEFLSNSGILLINQTGDQVDRWYQTGDEVDNPVHNPFQIDANPSTRWLQDGSYIRLKNINITYRFSPESLSSLGLNSLSIFVGGANLFTITNYDGYDPDVSYFDPLDGIIGQNISRGIDNFTAPQPRIFLTGFKIGF